MRVLGYHFIFTAYGFWLPNDPRGSWSDSVRAFHLQAFGPSTKVDTTHSLANRPHNRAARLAAKRALTYPPVEFTGQQARAIARGFAAASEEDAYNVHALAVLPDHVHLVMARHVRHVDEIASHLKAKASLQLIAEKLHPHEQYKSPSGRRPTPWSRNHWCPFIRSESHYLRAIEYVESNPVKAGLRKQSWSLVTPFESF